MSINPDELDELKKLIDERIANALETLAQCAIGNSGTRLNAADLRYVAECLKKEE